MTIDYTSSRMIKRNKELYGNEVAWRKKDYGIWKEFTWNDVYDMVKSFSLGLVALGLKQGESVNIIGENEPEFYAAEFATQAAGAFVACCYPDAMPVEAKYIIEDSGARFCVAEDQEQVDKLLQIKDETPTLEKVIYWDSKGMWLYDDPILISFQEVQELGRKYEQDHPGAFEANLEKAEPKDIAYLSYTSGTTGNPKGCIATWESAFENMDRWGTVLPFKRGMQYLTYISPAWAAEQFMGMGFGLYVPLCVNFPEEPETVTENIREVGAEILSFGARQWESLVALVEARMLDASWLRRFTYKLFMPLGQKVAEAKLEHKRINPLWRLLYALGELVLYRPLKDKLGLLKLKIAICGGSSPSPDVFRFFHALGVPLRNTYGMAETGMFTLHRDGAYKFESCGPVLETRYGEPVQVKISPQGEVLTRGGFGFQGYYRALEKTAEKLDEDGWYHTGDAGYFDDDGHLIYLDRVDDLRELSTGHGFPPTYIEIRLRYSPFVKDVMVLGDKTKSFVSALIDLDPETVGRWAERRSIPYTTYTELTQKKEIRELIRQEIAAVNKSLPEQSRVAKFANWPKPLDVDEGDLTRSRKLRREFVEKRYDDLIQAIYRGEDGLESEVAVKYRDGRTGVVRQQVRINRVDEEVRT